MLMMLLLLPCLKVPGPPDQNATPPPLSLSLSLTSLPYWLQASLQDQGEKVGTPLGTLGNASRNGLGTALKVIKMGLMTSVSQLTNKPSSHIPGNTTRQQRIQQKRVANAVESLGNVSRGNHQIHIGLQRPFGQPS